MRVRSRTKAGALALALLAAGGCTGAARPPVAEDATCARLLDQFDAYQALPTPGVDFRQMQLAKIRQYGCLTFHRQIADLEATTVAADAAAAPQGPRLSAPVAVHAGVVTSDADAARALAFFEGLGYRARSVGTPRLGTRIQHEARTAAEIEHILAVAREAGFVGPYVSRFARF